MSDKLNVAQYEYLIIKMNELVHIIDLSKKEFGHLPGMMQAILKWEKKVMELEARIETLKQVQ